MYREGIIYIMFQNTRFTKYVRYVECFNLVGIILYINPHLAVGEQLLVGTAVLRIIKPTCVIVVMAYLLVE